MNVPEPASLTLRGLSATIDHQAILRDIDLQVLPGELFVVLGTPGSGKSTLLRTIAGLERASAGEIRIDDRNITHTAARRRRIALMQQSCPLWPHRSVADNVGCAIRGRRLHGARLRDRIAHELGFVGLEEFARHLPAQLSTGQRQRVALARTLAADARLCLLDEPFNALDPLLRERLQRLLRGRQQRSGPTMLLATGDPQTALSAADRVAVIQNGEILQTGTPMELYDSPSCRHVANLLGSANLIDGEIELNGDQAMFRGENGVVIPLFDHALKRPRTGAAMFRPHDLRIVGDDQAPIGDEIRLGGRIEEMEFLGPTLRYRVDLSGKSAWLDIDRRDDRPRPNIGDQVVLGLDPTRILILDH